MKCTPIKKAGNNRYPLLLPRGLNPIDGAGNIIPCPLNYRSNNPLQIYNLFYVYGFELIMTNIKYWNFLSFKSTVVCFTFNYSTQNYSITGFVVYFENLKPA